VSAPRIVVTGLGAVSPLATSADGLWDALVAGASGVRSLERIDPDGLGTSVAGEVRGFDPLEHADARTVRASDPASVYLLAAAGEALAQAGLDPPPAPASVGVVAGVDVQHASVGRAALGMARDGRLGVDAYAIVQGLPACASGLVAHRHGLRGVQFAVSGACASGAVAILQAAAQIRLGYASAMVAGCASTLDRLLIGCCVAARVLTANPDPATASRPFDLRRDGFVIGEGAAALVLEDADHAQRRGAVALAELAGGWQTASTSGFTVNPAADAAACIEGALAAAGVAPSEVDLVGAPATSTRVGDAQEASALRAVLGERRVPTFAAKSALGHCMSAAAGLETVALVRALVDGVVPPTLNLREPDPDCDVDCATGARSVDARVALKDAFGFGGVNCCLVFRRAG
jgi:3-oxoacyl-[acyl-carrier-protein] synthase II